jgi:hypothetical protein
MNLLRILLAAAAGYLVGRSHQIDAERQKRMDLGRRLGLDGSWNGGGMGTVTPIDREKVLRHGRRRA